MSNKYLFKKRKDLSVEECRWFPTASAKARMKCCYWCFVKLGHSYFGFQGTYKLRLLHYVVFCWIVWLVSVAYYVPNEFICENPNTFFAASYAVFGSELQNYCPIYQQDTSNINSASHHHFKFTHFLNGDHYQSGSVCDMLFRSTTNVFPKRHQRKDAMNNTLSH